MPNSRNIIKKIVLTAAILLTGACDRETVFHQYRHTNAGGWEKNDTLLYNVGKIAHSGRFKEEIGIRMNGTYPFTGLSIIVEQTILSGNIITRDTLNCAFTGKNSYNNGVGYRQYKFHLKDVSLSKGDSVVLRVRHDMLREILPGIADVGIKISSR